MLSQYGVVDTLGEPDFEMLVEVLQVRCEVPMAAVAFVDRDRMWMKASRGFRVPVIPRLHCFCSVCMHYNPPMIVEDALLDPRFCENALVVGEPKLRFYAGFPIFSREGFGLGSVCVADTVPRTLNTVQRELMEKTRDWVEAVIEERRLEKLWKDSALCGEQDGSAEERAARAWDAVRRLV